MLPFRQVDINGVYFDKQCLRRAVLYGVNTIIAISGRCIIGYSKLVLIRSYIFGSGIS